MKSIFVTILLFLYLIPTFGINVTVHYCGGKISNIAFGTVTKDTCACGSKKMKKNCCEDKTFSFEVDDDQAKTQESILTFSKSLTFEAFLPQSFEYSYICFPLLISTDYFHHPPNYVKQQLYILNQVFRI